MVTFLMGYMGKGVAQLVAYVAVPLLILAAFYLALDSYGDGRYQAGKDDENAAWKAAQDKLLAEASKSSAKADRKALAVTLEHVAKVEVEKEKVDDAIANGSSPFDVLFPPDGVRAR